MTRVGGGNGPSLREQAGAGPIVVGAPKHAIRDLYHAALRQPWWVTLTGIVGVFLTMNVLFAMVYVFVGGIANARPGSIEDAFYFSVQTMGTVGYGAMYPESRPAELLVVGETVVGLIVNAMATGLIFAKFSRSAARIVFTREAVIAPMEDVPTLMFRVGNERGNVVFEATIRLAITRTERTKEGQVFYRLYDLALTRDRSPALARTWTVMHPIDERSPLYGETPETFRQREIELLVSVTGTDDTSLQAVHARHTYYDDEIVWGARHADVLREDEHGRLVLDIRRFHEVLPTPATEQFPYSFEGLKKIDATN